MLFYVFLVMATVVAAEVFAFERDETLQQEQSSLPPRLQNLYELTFPNHLHDVFAANSTLNEAVRQVEEHLASRIGDIRIGCASYEVGATVGK